MPASSRYPIASRFSGLPAGVIMPPIILAIGSPIIKVFPLFFRSSGSSYILRRLKMTVISTAVVATFDMIDDKTAAQSMTAKSRFLLFTPKKRISSTKILLESGTAAMASEIPNETNVKNRTWFVNPDNASVISGTAPNTTLSAMLRIQVIPMGRISVTSAMMTAISTPSVRIPALRNK